MRFLLTLLTCALVISDSVATAREWVDITGKFRVEAELLSVSDGTVTLRTRDGREVAVPLKRLSQAAQNFARRTRPTPSPPQSLPLDRLDTQRLLAEFERNATTDTYLALRRAIMASPKYDPYSTDVIELKKRLDARQYAHVVAEVEANENLWLSPRAHQMASEAAKKLGRGRIAEKEESLISSCLRAIQRSGDGTWERPYTITRLSDEYDLLSFLGQRPTGQEQLGVNQGPLLGAYLDRLICEDDSQFHFNVTELFVWRLRKTASSQP